MIRKLAVFSGSRAEYGILKNLIYLVHKDVDIELALMIGGSHLSSRDGLTREEIDADGIPVTLELDFQLLSGSSAAVAKSTGLALVLASDALKLLEPDAILLVGDRYETLAVALAAFCMRIPILHLHGGEITEGAIDDSFRHCVTKLASRHFAASEEYATRIIQLGENPSSVKFVGSLCNQNIINIKPLPKQEFIEQLGLGNLNNEFVFLAVHPETTATMAKSFRLLEYSLTAVLENTDAFILASYANLDSGGNEMNERLERIAAKNSDRMLVRPSFGQQLFLNSNNYSKLIIVNSSSGMIEAPIIGTHTINIGDRQKGRSTEDLIVSCNCDLNDICHAVKNLWQLTTSTSYKKIRKSNLPRTAELILSDLKSEQCLDKQPFFDIHRK